MFNPKKDNDEKNQKAEDIAKIIDEWLNEKHIDAKTRLSKQQVVTIAILKTLADKYNIKPLQTLLKNFQRYKLSEDGESSKELVKILSERTQDKKEDSNIFETVGRFLES
jgi:hypothetical protein